MEKHLDALEKKIEDMLAKAEEDEKALSQPKPAANGSSANDERKPAA